LQDSEDEFARLFAKHQRLLFGHLVTLLGNTSDAEEVLQETCVVLLRERAKFRPGSNFVSWALVIAHNQVHRFRRSQKRQRQIFSSGMVDSLASECEERCHELDARRDALSHCIDQLAASDRELVDAAYAGEESLKDVAERLGRPSNTVYKALHRVRRALLECVQRNLRAKERP